MAKNSEATLLVRIKEIGSDVLEKLSDGFEKLKDYAVSAYAIISANAAIAIKAFYEQEKATKALNTTLINQGIYTKELSSSYAQMASELQKTTTYADENITSAQAVAQQFMGNIPITKELTKSILDFATAQGIDASQAAEVVGKAIGTNTNALARYGIEVSATASKQEKMTQIMAGLNTKFGGQSEAAAKGLGSLLQLKNAIGDIYEAIGERLAPTISAFAKILTQNAESISSSTTLLERFETVVNGTIKSLLFMGLVAKDVWAIFDAVFTHIGSTIKELLIGSVINNTEKTAEAFKAMADQMSKDRAANMEAFYAQMEQIDNAYIDKKKNKMIEEEENLRASNERKRQIQAEANTLSIQDFELAKTQEQIKQEEFELLRTNKTLANQLTRINQELANEQNRLNRLELLRKKELLLEEESNKAKAAGADSYTKYKIFLAQTEVKATMDSLQFISSLSTAKNKELAAIGKAAGIAQATVNTSLAMTNALAHVPFPFGFAAAAAIGAAGAVQIAKISGVELADGGIVKARPGGMPAIIGEGGSDEAVIPLDSAEAQNRLGSTINITFTGPMMGDQYQAREFAVAIDRELLKLRKDGESLSFDTRLT